MKSKALLLATALFTAGAAQATCYSVYKADGTLLQESSTPPVNLALQIGDTVPEKFGPGATLTVSDHSVYCKDKRESGDMRKSLAEALLEDPEKETEKARFVIKRSPPAEGETSTAAR